MIDEESRTQLIAYRVAQAKSTALEAEFLLKNDMLRGSMNRIYVQKEIMPTSMIGISKSFYRYLTK